MLDFSFQKFWEDLEITKNVKNVVIRFFMSERERLNLRPPLDSHPRTWTPHYCPTRMTRR